MSKNGIKIFVDILTEIQHKRIELLGGDNQDICLGQLLDVAKEAVKLDFMQIVSQERESDGE